MASTTAQYIKTVNSASARRGFLLSVLETVLNGAQDMLVGSRLSPVRSLAKSSVLSLLKNVQHGRLRIEEGEDVYEFGEPYILCIDGPPKDLKVTIRVQDESFWTRVFLHPDLGFADAYMLEEIQVDNLNDVFRIFVLNRKVLGEMHTFISPIVRAVGYIANWRMANTLDASKSNISAHYDVSNEVFAAFLSWDMTYSCAVFNEEAKGCTGDLIESRPIAPPRDHKNKARTMPPDDLERGQTEKLHMIARRARIKKGSHVLEIGCGWGSFSILAAGTYGATVEALTLSVEQKSIADERIREAGLEDVINVHVMDYRDMPAYFHHAFDAVVSIGVMEHVGIEYMDEWFRKIEWAMKVENSYKVFTMTTVPDTRWHRYATEVDFVRKYIYPGGQLSSVKTLVNSITAAGLNVESIEDIGPHYARTLREWSRRFEQNFDLHIGPALQKQYSDLTEEGLRIFQRKWIYYFAYTEAGFATRSISDHVFVVTRESNINV